METAVVAEAALAPAATSTPGMVLMPPVHLLLGLMVVLVAVGREEALEVAEARMVEKVGAPVEVAATGTAP